MDESRTRSIQANGGFTQMPKITGVTPNNGIEGTQIKISGEGFGAARGSSLLEIGGKNVNHVSWGDKEITTQIPDGVSETPHIRIRTLGAGASEIWQFNPQKPVPGADAGMVDIPADAADSWENTEAAPVKPAEVTKPADKAETPKTA
jgi:hypothetical protein